MENPELRSRDAELPIQVFNCQWRGSEPWPLEGWSEDARTWPWGLSTMGWFGWLRNVKLRAEGCLVPWEGLGEQSGQSEEGGSLWGCLGGGLTRHTLSCGLWMPLLPPQSSFLSKGSLPHHDLLQLQWVPLDSPEIKKWMNAPMLDSSAPPGLAPFNTLQWDPFSTSILSLNFTHISPQGIHSPFLVRVLIRLMKRGNYI